MQVLIPDELVITSRLMERWVLENGFGSKVLVYSGILRSLEEKLRRGDEAGINAFKSLREACERAGAALEIVDVEGGAEDLRTALRTLAVNSGGEIVTSDPVTARLCEALSIKFRYLAPSKILDLEKIFQGGVMSLHLKESVPLRVKKGVPGAWRFEELSARPMSREELELIIAQIMMDVYSTLGRESFIEVEKGDTMIVQLRDFRIVITRPPLSDGLEVTVVRPIVRRSLEDYELHPSLMERLVEKAEGILVAGPPGMGKSTFAQALAEYYRSLGMVVKTIESPRDLQVSSEITQYS
ncbi:MAG: ATPase, partial [Nitrososphaerota archaeon]